MNKIPPGIKTWGARLFTAGLGQFFSFGSRFIRNIILARLLLPGEFGAAVAIAATCGLAVATDLGLDRYAMLRGTEQSLSAAHLLALVRAALLAIIFVALAPLAAELFGVPGDYRSFQLVAAIAAFGGLQHLGIRQIWRDHQYGPDTKAQIIASIGLVAVIFPAMAILHDHRVMVVSLFTEVVLYGLASHYWAQAPFHLRAGMTEIKTALTFSLPLMLNGVGLVVMQQLDRFLVGYWFGVAELALYAVAVSLAIIPGTLLLSICGNVGLSYIINSREHGPTLTERYHIIFFMYALMASAYMLFLFLTLDTLIPLIFGRAFSVSPLMQASFSVIGYLRLLRAGAPTTLLLAQNRTRSLALLNLSSMLGFLAGFIAVTINHKLEFMLTGFAVGEIGTYILFLLAVKQSMTSEKLLNALTLTLPLPIILLAVFAVMPEPALGARAVLFLTGCLAMSALFGYHAIGNSGLRSTFSSTTIAGTRE